MADQYGRHSYYDVSKLNARWDRDWPGGYPMGPVAGLDGVGLGGGSLGNAGNGMGILGADDDGPSNPITPTFTPKISTAQSEKSLAYPWGEYSENTLAFQKAANKELPMRGFEKLTEDGKLGGKTCSAHRILGMGELATCKSYSPLPLLGQPPPVAPPPPPIAVLEEPPKFAKAGLGGSSWMWIGGGVALLVITAAVVAKKNKAA